MHYDFIEIGTSDFETLIEKATPDQRGLSIEPVSSYLNKLPNKPNVTKLPFAVSPTGEYRSLELYWVPEELIIANSLPMWLKGCNSVGKYHHQHEVLNIKHLVRVESIACVPVSYLFTAFNIDSINLLKIDVEGNDALIMLQFWEYITNHGKWRQWPKRCEFESNELCDQIDVERVIQRFTSIGYTVVNYGHDTILELRK